MFYVSGTKVYLATFDEKCKVFPEVKLAWAGPDQLKVVRVGGGIAQKPGVYSICTLTELIAQFGGAVVPPTADEKSRDERSKKD